MTQHTIGLATSYACGALAGLLFGMDVGVIAGALPLIRAEFGISAAVEGWVVSSMLVGAIVGAVAAGPVSRRYGRRNTLSASATLYLFGAAAAFVAPTVDVLIGARVCLGLAVGASSLVAPLYLAEVSPAKTRGSVIALYQLLITVGILSAFMSDLIVSHFGGWRYMFGFLIVPSVLLFIACIFAKPSPRWLFLTGRNDYAMCVLAKLRSEREGVDEEAREILASIAKRASSNGFSLFKHNRNYRRAIYFGIAFMLLAQLTGINAIMYFAPTIFRAAGFASETGPLAATVITGLVNVLATILAVALIDRLGRKTLLYGGLTASVVALALLSFSVGAAAEVPSLRYLSLAMVLLFTAGFAASVGPVVWTICAEVQPARGRDLGLAVSTTANWFGNFCVGQFFPLLMVAVGASTTFIVFLALNVLIGVFTMLFVPETKDVSLEYLEARLMGGQPLRRIGVVSDA